MKVKVCSHKELLSFERLRKEIKESFGYLNKELNKVYEYILFILKSLDSTKKFYNDIIEIIKSIEHFENLIKSKYFYDKNNKAIRKDYKKLNALYPKDKIRSFYDKNTITMNKCFNPNDYENRLKFSNRRLKTFKTFKYKEIIAFDTETYLGHCKLICRNINGNKRKEVSLLNPTFDDCLKFLTYHIDNVNNNTNGIIYRFMFNIDFDIQAILKLYPYQDKLDFIDKLSKGITMEYKNQKHTYYLSWIRSKFFKIKVKERQKSVLISDLYSFYNLSLGKSAKKFLKFRKDKIDGKRLNTDLNYWCTHEKNIIKYCIKDCNLTKDLGKLLIDKIIKQDLKLPKFLISPASLSKQNFRFDNFIPNLKHTPIKVIQIAYNSYFGGRFEVLKRGYFDKCFLYDIVSQYPSFIKELPDLFNGFWIESKNLRELPKEKCIGYFKVLVNIPMKEKLPTLPIKYKGLTCFSNGTHWNWYTWFDLDLMRDYIVEIKKAIIFKPNDNNFNPFLKGIDNLMNKKKLIDKKNNELEYNIVKLTQNGLYGTFIERHEKYYLDDKGNIFKRYKAGILFNPIYASQITGFGRWSVIKDIPKTKQKNVIAIHTDSIITDIDCNNYLDIGKDLGKWNLENTGKTIIIGTGIYQIGKKVKTRGIPFKYVKNWFKFLKKNKNQKSFTFVIEHMRKVREAIIQDKSIINMNRMIDIERTVNCNSDLKRTWFDDFFNFNDLKSRNIDSLPYYSFENEFGLSLNPIIISQIENIPLNQTIFILKNSGY